MTNKEIEAGISEIDSQISKLTEKRSKLEKQLFEQCDDFVTKFKAWYSNSDESHQSYYPDRKKFPLLREKLDEWDHIERHQRIDLNWMYEEAIYLITNMDEVLKEETQEHIDGIIEEWRPHLEEVMNGNVKSFCVDW